MSSIESYKSARQPLPARMLKWRLYGKGLENLHVEEVEVPTFGPDELLVRQDACGLCFSDTKVINLGPEHPRMAGRDMERDPVTLGHEVSCTIVGVGAELAGRFHVGQRFIVQADVFYHGKSIAYGYAISGGLAEYSVIPKEMIDGDDGCYLLPIQPDAGYAETALVEPWACVVSAYNQGHRASTKPGGTMLVLCGDGLARPDWSGIEVPARVVAIGDPTPVMGLCPATETRLAPAGAEEWAALKQEATGGAGFDDIVVLGAVAPDKIEGAATTLADHGILNVVGPSPIARKLAIDIGRIHYNWHHYIGTTTGTPADAYAEPRSADLTPGGAAWFIGAGGPMGQMHVQRAVFHPAPPRLIVATDIDAERLGSVADRFAGAARARGIELVTLNPKEMSPEAFDAELRRSTDGKGYDDVVSLVPVPALIEHAAAFLGDRGWMNIFAGVARGTIASLDLNPVRARRVRYIGSSGSALSDMQQTLDKVESGELSTNASLAALGGMCAVKDGMAAVKDARFPGKTLIFPLLHDLPLMSLSELQQAYPSVYAKLQDGRFWTKEAEEELLRVVGTSS